MDAQTGRFKSPLTESRAKTAPIPAGSGFDAGARGAALQSPLTLIRLDQADPLSSKRLDLTMAPASRRDLGAPGRALALVLFLAAIAVRLPEVIVKGRFYAEEGPFFFGYAWHMPWRDALFHTLGGYLNIVASATTLADATLVRAGWLSLDHAPYFTQGVALAFQACPAVVILTARADWLTGRWRRLAALALVATAPLAEQVWLHTLHSQFHLGLAAAIILALEAEAGPLVAAFRLGVLALGPLCGPASILLAPFFVARAALERTPARAVQAAATVLGAAVQLALFYAGSRARGFGIDAPTLLSVLAVRHIALPLFGPDVAMGLAAAARVALRAGAIPWGAVGLGAAAVLGVLGFAATRWRRPEAWLIVAALVLAVVSYIGGIRSGPLMLDPAFAGRYAFAPQVLLDLAALAACEVHPRARWLVGWLIAVGLYAGLTPLPDIAHGPDWRAEVEAWRADPQHRLQVWPKGWLLDLAPGGRACLPAAVEDPDAPDYCDQAWEKL